MKRNAYLDKKVNTYRHKEDGAFIHYGGFVTKQLPIGFGFRGGKFVVDAVRAKYVSGFCEGCKADGLFLLQAKAVTKVPRKINSKIAQAEREVR